MVQIRQALQGDLAKIVDLHFERAKEFNFKNIPKPNADLILKNVLHKWQLAPCFVLEYEGEIVGFAGMTVDTFYWSDEPYASDYMVFVKKPHRSMEVVKTVYKTMSTFAHQLGVPFRSSHVVTDGRITARMRLMKMLGFSVDGFIFSSGDN